MRRSTVAALVAAMTIMSFGAAYADDAVPQDVASTLGTTMPRASMANDSFYFVMTDRYANGTTTNDKGSPDPAQGLAFGGSDRTDPGMFHGGDLLGLTQNLDRVRRMGFNAIWITPPFVNRAVQGGSAGYHGYWILDFTQIDPHLGTARQFMAFVQRAHALGLKVFLDIVMNHTADVIRYRSGDYSFSATPKPDAYIPAGLENLKSPAWLNDLANYHNQGSISDWSSQTQMQQGDFYGLDDIKTENQAVVDGFAQVFGNWIVQYGIDGFRIDTARHVDPQYFLRWVPALVDYVRTHGKPEFAVTSNFDMFGEVATADPVYDSMFVRNQGLASLLDFPLQDSIVSYLKQQSAAPVRDVLAYDDFYNTGTADTGTVANAYSLATFTGNHDMGRIGYLLGGIANVPRVEIATALTYLLRGAPVVYYGDEVGMVGIGGDKEARQDMFPTGVLAWRTQSRLGAKPIGKGSSLTVKALSNPIAKYITALNGLRTRYPALRDGALQMRTATGGVLGWSRFDASDRREFVVLTNASSTTARVQMQTSSPGSVFASVLGVRRQARAAADGKLSLTVPGTSVLVLRAATQLPMTTAAPQLSVTAALDRDAGGAVLSASQPTTLDPITVSFIARSCPTCAWRALGSDDNAPYRLVLADSAWAGNDAIDVAAIARTSDGRAAAGPILHLTKASLQ